MHRSAVRQAGEAVNAQRRFCGLHGQRFPSVSLSSQYGAVAYPQGGFPLDRFSCELDGR